MPSFTKKVPIPGKSSQEVFDTMSSGIEQFLTKAAVGKFQVDRDPQKKELRIKSSLFSATLVCSESEMEVQAQLSLLAMPFKSKFDEGITRWVNRAFERKVV